jgi:hypothetical protein
VLESIIRCPGGRAECLPTSPALDERLGAVYLRQPPVAADKVLFLAALFPEPKKYCPYHADDAATHFQCSPEETRQNPLGCLISG